MTVTFAGLIAYISSIQQIVFEVFDAPQLIGLVFACDRRADGARLLGQQPRSSTASACAASATQRAARWRWSPRSTPAIAPQRA